MTEQEIREIVKESFTKSEVIRKLGYHTNGTGTRIVTDLINTYNIDISHFDRGHANIKYLKIEKQCPVCGKVFVTQLNHPREKTVCSHACSNTYFRSGSDHPSWKDISVSDYRKSALRNFPNKCNRCGWDQFVQVLQVHHIDRNRSNNELSNLEILCPNCHQSEHFIMKDGWFCITHKSSNIREIGVEPT